jgi:peptide/nickel transport system permease protein
MRRIILGRLLQGLGVLLVVALLGFTLTSFSDPVSGIAGPNAPDEVRQKLRSDLRLDDPFLLRFTRFVGAAATGDFGRSYVANRAVRDVIAERLPATIELGLAATLLSLVIGVPLGVYTALRRNGLLSRALMTLSLVGMSLPNFVLGIGLIFVFAVTFRWLPSFGRGELTVIAGWPTGLATASGLKALVMPALALAIPQSTLVMRLVRAEMLEVLRTDFIRFAMARGLTSRRINYRHALRNALLPVITITGLQVGSLLGFAIVVEVVFQWPGMGLLFIQSIQQSDIPVIAAALLLIGFFFVIVNLVVDLLYLAVDPRLRGQAEPRGASAI